jgi:AraC-like DNA-binding protein
MPDVEDVMVMRQPAEPLRPYVEAYLGYRLMGFPPGLHRGLPSRHLTFIVSVGSPIDVARQTNPTDRPRGYRAVLSGLQASSALIAHDGNQEGVGIELTPLGARALFGVPARELWDTSLELSEVVGGTGDELWERLQPGASWDDRFAVCDEVLLRLAGARAGAGGAGGAGSGATAVAPELARSWQELVRSGGTVTVNDLAADTGWSRQHLGRRFRDEFGLSPKLAARVIRFDRAKEMLRSIPSYVSVADVAATCGYYDQAHLHRDVALLAGCTPRELLADIELPDIELPDADLPGSEQPGVGDAPFVQDAAVAAM